MASPGSSVTAARRRRALGASAVALLLGASMAACGGDDEPAAEPPTASGSASPSAEESPSGPSESSGPSASTTPTPSASPSGPASSGPSGEAAPLTRSLLAAAEVPGLNAESAWAQGRTGPVGTAAFGWCSRFDALTIGAREGVQRTFTSGGDRAGQQVLDFVDATNARRAEQVFRGWHRDCSGARTGQIQEVPASGGTAWWYLSNRPAGAGRWEAFGLALQDSRITVLRMEHVGQDHSYPPGEDPLERVVATAAAKLA